MVSTMLEVCTNYSGGTEEGEVVQFLRKVTFELTLKRSVGQQCSNCDLCVHGGPQDLFREFVKSKLFT